MAKALFRNMRSAGGGLVAYETHLVVEGWILINSCRESGLAYRFINAVSTMLRRGNISLEKTMD